MKRPTIAAISTPFGSGGIGILRLSGSRSVKIAAGLFRKSRTNDPDYTDQPKGPFASHQFYHGHIVDTQSQEIIDEVLVVAMLAPRSYTREDVVEIHSHSGIVVLEKIFRQVLTAGAVMAEPGEFTKRAFLNGRIDLTQAEAVTDIINAKTGQALRIANQQLAGGLTEKIDSIRDVLISIRALLEAAIDFPEDIQDSLHSPSIIKELEQGVIEKIEQMLRDYRQGHFYRDGVKMAIIGRPNVGKSSLMNRLIDRDRAIVTAVPGTTRDVIEDVFHIKGLPVIIMDTAGLHDAPGEVEKIGIQKTRQSIEAADIILFMVDSSEALHPKDMYAYGEIAYKKHLILLNKIDLTPKHNGLNVPDAWLQHSLVQISALTGRHIDKLKQLIWTNIVGQRGVCREIAIVPNLRHKRGLEQCLIAGKRALQALSEDLSAEFVAADLAEAIVRLDSLLGDHCDEDILDQIFSRFCIGK